jgi:thioredoxin-related protein
MSVKFAKNLDIVTIVSNVNPAGLSEYCNKNNFNWQFLIAENTKSLLKEYKVKAYPSFYLIDPYGTIILSPSPGPEGSFEAVFAKILSGRN